MELQAEWLGRISYRDAWRLQHERVADRVAGRIGDRVLLMEHSPVLTLGRNADRANILASPGELAARGIEVIEVERGGEVTYHGPGQLVAYPIVKLADHELLLRPFVRALEAAMTDVAAGYGVTAGRRDGFPGCWVDLQSAAPRKLGALGLKIERGVSYHGIALNVTTDLADFDLIRACGLDGVDVTSIAREAAWQSNRGSSDASVGQAGRAFAAALRTRLDQAADGSRRAARERTAAAA